MRERIIIHENEDCDAEYFLCAWFGMDRMPKHRMILPAEDIVKIMEAYHNQKPRVSEMPTEEEIEEAAREYIKNRYYPVARSKTEAFDLIIGFVNETEHGRRREMKETIWQELQRFIDSIRDEAKSADPDQVSIDFWLFKIERRIKILKDAIEKLKGETK